MYVSFVAQRPARVARAALSYGYNRKAPCIRSHSGRRWTCAQRFCDRDDKAHTSIYSGILRLEDLARSMPGCACHLYLVAPNAREKEVMAQLARPAFRSDLADISLAYMPFKELRENCDALCRFGEDHTILRKIARTSG